MYDLTYFSEKNVTESAVQQSRKQKLRNYLESENLNFGDEIRLRYVGTSDYGENPSNENNVLKVFDTFDLSGENEKIYTLRYRCLPDKFKKKLTFYYTFFKEDESAGQLQVDKKKLIDAVLSKIDEMYSKGAYNR